MILPAEENNDLALYDYLGRNEAGTQRVVYRSLRPSPGDAPSKQGELIKQAASEGASVLVVVPDTTKETADAIAALDPKKTPVVLLGRSTAGTLPPSATLVTFEGFPVSAKKIVDAVVEDAPKIGAAADAPAILVTGKAADESRDERIAALADALKAAKIRVVATVAVDSDPAVAAKAVEDVLRANLEVRTVFADDEAGVTAANTSRRELPARRYLSAGYFSGRNNLQSLMTGYVSALGERSIEMLVRRAIRAAVDRAEGKTVPAKVLVEIPIRRGFVAGNVADVAPPGLPDHTHKEAAEPEKAKAPAATKKDEAKAPAETKKD